VTSAITWSNWRITAASPEPGDALRRHRWPTCGDPTGSQNARDEGETPMTASTGATQSAQPERKGRKDGVAGEFTIIAKIKPGHADALRERITGYQSVDETEVRRAAFRRVGTLHDARHVMINNDTQFLFATTFDGDWDAYIDDFKALAVAEGPGAPPPSADHPLDGLFSHCEGYPGFFDPSVKEWLSANQVSAGYFYSAYPDLTVQQIWKDQRVNQAFQDVLDSPAFRKLLDNPATAELRAEPAFQKLLDEAAG
jgi:hypothetical protein